MGKTLTVLEKKGLHQTVGILETYGIDCETDVSLLDRDDFSKLSSNGLKPMEGKKLERWCDSVRTRAENMLSSSLNTTSGATLLSSEVLNVLTLPAHSATVAEFVSGNDSERGGEEDNNVSDNDLKIVGEQSGTVHSTGTASGGTESPAKKSKITFTEEQEAFAQQFKSASSKIDKTRKINLRHVSDRGGSMEKQS